jgi:hypothetical protein
MLVVATKKVNVDQKKNVTMLEIRGNNMKKVNNLIINST